MTVTVEVYLQTLVELPDAEVEALDRLAQKENISRSVLIERAVHDFLQKSDKQKRAEAFGLWGNRIVDGLDFQQKVRDEW